MHIEDDVDGFFVFDEAAQYQAGEEGFAGACFSKDAIAAFNKAVEVDADGCVHI